MHAARSLRGRTLATLGALALTLTAGVVALQTAAAPTASAHGAVTDPPTRNYSCYDRWGEDHWQDPIQQTVDPMCWGAWTTDPNAMWNWNGMYQNGLGTDYKSKITGGSVCSAGHAESGRYDYLDTPGKWVAKGVKQNFTLTLTDGANHGADWLEIYVTKAGFDPTTQKVDWSNLELVKTTGRYPATSPYVTDVTLPSGRSGRAVLVTVWLASHQDQKYFLCSDINIGGGDLWPTTSAPLPGSTTPPTDPTTPPTDPTTPPTDPTTPPTDPTTTPPTGPGTCTAAVKVVNSWPGGYQADVTIKAGSSAITGWKATITGATITQAWSSTLSGNVLTNEAWNGSLAAGASTTAGFIGSGTAPTSATCAAS